MSRMAQITGLVCAGLMVSLAACAGMSSPPPPPKQAPSRSEQSREYGKQFLVEARKQYRFVKNPEVVHAIHQVGRRILTAAGGDPDEFHFLIVKQLQPNAFVIPGGYIFLFDGLLTRLNSEHELAGVLAHEIGHVTSNHFFKDEKKVMALDLATIAAILLSRGQASTTAIALATGISAQLQFSRENEREADDTAIRYINRAGYDPAGLLDFLKGLLAYEDIHGVDIPAYLSTHPAIEERIQTLDLRLSRPGDRINRKLTPPVDWERIRTIMRAKNQSWQDVRQLLPDPFRGDLSEERRQYLSGLAYLTTDQVAQSIEAYQAALKLNPGNPLYHADLAMAYLKAQDINKAESAALESLKRAGSGEAPAQAHFVLGMLEMHRDRPQKAAGHFEAVLQLNPKYAFAHYHAGQAYFAMDRKPEGIYHTGRYLRLSLKPEEALHEFRRAQKIAGKDSDLARKIEEEIRQIRKYVI